MSGGGRSKGAAGADRAVLVTLPRDAAEVAGAVLMDLWGPFELQQGGGEKESVTLIFYPPGDEALGLDAVLEELPPGVAALGDIAVETRDVPRDWVEGWRDHFHSVQIGRVCVRPPWEPAAPGAPAGTRQPSTSPSGSATARISKSGGPIEVVINPGLGFGTGLHPTTRGTLQLLQLRRPDGRVVDAGTGSGILAVAAAKLGWSPVEAFDNDPLALLSAHENVEVNGVETTVRIHEADVSGAPRDWFPGATVLANMTLEPVIALVRRLSGGASTGATPAESGATEKGDQQAAGAARPPRRLVVSGILAGAQEIELLRIARECGFAPGRRLYEGEWVSLELLPDACKGKQVGSHPTDLAGA